MNRPITTKEIKSVIKKKKRKKRKENLPTNKSPGPDDFIGDILPNLQRINTYPSQTIPKNSTRARFPNAFYKVSIILIPKPVNTTMEKKL